MNNFPSPLKVSLVSTHKIIEKVINKTVKPLAILSLACVFSNVSYGEMNTAYDSALSKLEIHNKAVNKGDLSIWLNKDSNSAMHLINFIKLSDADTELNQKKHRSKMKRLLKKFGGGFHSIFNTQMTFDSSTGDEWDVIEVVYLPHRHLLLSLANNSEYGQARAHRAQNSIEMQSYLIDDADTDNPFDERQDDPDKNEFYMVNLNEYLDFADYGDGPTDMTGEEATQLYLSLIMPMLNEINTQFILTGDVIPVFVDDTVPNWNGLAIVRYPSESEFYATVGSPAFQEAIVHKWAALKNNSTTMTQKVKNKKGY